MQTVKRGRNFTGNVIWKHKACGTTTRYYVGRQFFRNGSQPESTVNTDGFVRRDWNQNGFSGFANWFAPCNGCGKLGRLELMQPIMGALVEEKVCDARCMNATRNVCECACGGMNHGGSHAA